MEELILAYEEYIKLLNEEISEMVGMMYVHGWSSKRVQEGKDCREKIKQLKQNISKKD